MRIPGHGGDAAGDEAERLSWDEWEQRVRAGRVPPDALVRFPPVTGDAFQPASTLELYRSLRDDQAVQWRARFATGAPPVLTALLVGVQIRVWWWAHLDAIGAAVLRDGLNQAPAVLEDGEVWRLLSMGFLHLDWDHLLLNMLWLAYTGAALERSLGRANLLALYLASVVGGSVLSLAGAPETASLGASGGVFGLIAAVVVFGFRRPDLLPRRGQRLFGLAMLPYLVVMFGMGLLSETTDNWSHFGGLLTGGALAFALDPPDLERRRGWTRGWVVAIAVGIAATLLGAWVLGPRLAAVEDIGAVRARRLPAARVPAPDPLAYVELEWSAPAAWQSGLGGAGVVGFTSPSPRARGRSFAVRSRGLGRPTAPDALVAEFVATLERSFSSVTVAATSETALAGRPATRADLVVGDAADRVSYTVAVRGTHALEAFWQAEAGVAARLEPLHARLLDAVVWREPLALVEARATVARNPDSPRGRTDLAAGLAEIGEVDEAARLYVEVATGTTPYEPAWEGLVRLLGTWPEALPEAEVWLDQALAASPRPPMVLEVVGTLEARGREDLARGLLEVAWAGAPGDRRLKRARRQRGLPVALDPIALAPAHLISDPETGRLPRTPLVPAPPPLTLATAAQAEAARAAVESVRLARLEQAVARGPQGAVDALLVLSLGYLPEQPAEADLAAVASDLGRAARGSPPRWLPPDLAARLDEAGVAEAVSIRRAGLGGPPTEPADLLAPIAPG